MRVYPSLCRDVGQLPKLALTMTVAGLMAVSGWPANAQQPGPATPTQSQPAAEVTKIPILFARESRERPPPLSLLDLPNADDGIAGGKLGILDNNTTGRFLKQEFALETIENEKPNELVAGIVKKVDSEHIGFVILDTPPQTVLAVADALKGKPVQVINAGSPDDSLREENCRANVKHTPPTRTMLADALAQYLAWKQWRKWFLVVGPREEDKLMAEAYRRAAKKFGAKIVDERTFTDEGGSRRSDGGYEQVQQQIPSFTQGAADHDVAVVADEAGLFGDYFPYRTWQPRPVAGTSGLYPASWHPALELWGATQFQNRFKRLAGRNMRTIDYTVWMAVRAVGEAASRKRTGDPKTLIDYMASKEFELAAFKGVGTSFRSWNGQLRQPILVATAKLPVTVSPQPGFLHQYSVLDTLGVDKPETKCKAYAQ